MSDLENRDPLEVPPATHPGEVYTIDPKHGDCLLDGRGDVVFWLGDADRSVVRRLVHCRNLVDGPDEYAEHYEGVEHPGLDADIAAVCGELDERLARRIAERVAREGSVQWGSRFSDLLAICREEVARWAEPDDQDAPPARPDAPLSPEDADRGGE